MIPASFRYSVFNPEEIKPFNEGGTGCPTDNIVTVKEGTTSRADATCYEVDPQGPNKVLGDFEYQVSNVNGEHRITEIRFERGKDVLFREQLAAFHFAKTWYKNHDDKHEQDADKYAAFVAGYKIIYKSDNTANDDKQSTPTNPRSVIGVKKSTQHTVSENNIEADRYSTYTDFDALSTTSAYQQENTFLGRLTTKLKSRFSATTDHTNFHSALLTDTDDMIQSGLKDYDLGKSSVVIATGETLPLAEVKSGMNSVVEKLRKANPNKTTLFPIGVSERGTYSSGHTVLGVVTPTTTFIIDSDSFNFYGVIESIRSGFQGLRDTSNCGRYAAHTCIELAKAIDNHLGSKRTVDAESKGTVDVESKRTVDAESKGTVDVESKGTVDVESKGTVDAESKGTVDAESKGTVDVESKGTVDVESKGTVDVESKGTVDVGSTRTVDVESKRTVDEKYIRKTLSSFTRPSLETLRQLSLATSGVSVENKTDEAWEQIEIPNG